jgi:hypothetical protein
MSELILRPRRGGFLRPFGCGQFIYEYLSGQRPHGSPVIDTSIGAPQADIFHYYKRALINITASNRAITAEERAAKFQKRSIDPGNIEELTMKYLKQLPYKSIGCRYHSFVVYFSTLRRLNWVEHSGYLEHSEFQDNYEQGKPRVYYRLTAEGMSAPLSHWLNPYAIYRGR